MWILKSLIAYFLCDAVQCFSCSVFLTISTNGLVYYDTSLVINWGPDCETPPITIKLFEYNPFEVETTPTYTAFPRNEKSGRIETNLNLKALSFPYHWDSASDVNKNDKILDRQQCLDYFIVSYNQTNHVTTFDCLKIHPQWMTEMTELWSLPLKQLFIPGTHCSGCYMTRENAKNRMLRQKGFSQNFDVWHQLVFGVRYLEFSVELFDKIGHLFYDPDGPSIEKLFWITNGDNIISPIFPILREVKKFVERSQEVVILSFSGFSKDFSENPELHEVFKQLLSDEIGSLAYLNKQNGSKSFDLTIADIKNDSKNLLITYDSENLSVMSGEFNCDSKL